MRRHAIWLLFLLPAAGVAYFVATCNGDHQGDRASARPLDSAPVVSAPGSAPVSTDGMPGTLPHEPDPAPASGQRPPVNDRLDTPSGSPRDASPLDLDRRDPIELLGTLRQQPGRGDAEALAIARDDREFAKLFTRHATGPVADGSKVDPKQLLDGATLEYGDGVFEFPWAADGRCPRDLVLKGAGMDRTLLRIKSGPLRAGDVRGLTVLGLTIDCRGKTFLAAESVTMQLEHCRVANAINLLAGGTIVVHARACRFEDVKDLLHVESGLVRFDDCVLRGEDDEFLGRSTCLFLRCTFLHSPPNLAQRIEGKQGISIEDCVFDERQLPRYKLGAINPAWKD